MVVDECWFAGGLRVGKRLGMELGGVVFVGQFMRGKKLWGVFVVMGMYLERMGVVFCVIVLVYSVSFKELHL